MEYSNVSEKLLHSLLDRHTASPIFNAARALQEEIASNAVTKEEVVGAWVVAQKILGKINSEVKDEGLFGLEVNLTGDGIKAPTIVADLGAAALLSSINDSPLFEKDSLAEYERAHEVRGAFTGFTLDFVKRDDETFAPTLAYQVATGMHTTPNLSLTAHATGPIATTRLAFVEDEQRDLSTELALSLLEKCGESYWSNIRLVQEASIIEGNLDASRLRHLAYHAEKVVNDHSTSDSVATIERHFIDMIDLAIPKGWTAKISADQALQMIGGQKNLYSQNVLLTAPISGALFSDEIRVKTDETTELTGRRVLCIVAAMRDNGIVHIPISSISDVDTI